MPRSAEVFLLADVYTAAAILQGAIGMVLFLRTAGAVKPCVHSTLGVDTPTLDVPPTTISPKRYNQFVMAMLDFGEAEKWTIIVQIVPSSTTESVDSHDDHHHDYTSALAKIKYPLTVSDGAWVSQYLADLPEESRLEVLRLQYRTQLVNVVKIIDGSKPALTKGYNIDSETGDDLESLKQAMELRRRRLRLSDESLQMVSKSDIEHPTAADAGGGRPTSSGEVWSKGYSFFRKILE